MTLGECLREMRQAADLTQEALALAADVDRTTLVHWERDARTPGRVPLMRVLDALEASDRDRGRVADLYLGRAS